MLSAELLASRGIEESKKETSTRQLRICTSQIVFEKEGNKPGAIRGRRYIPKCPSGHCLGEGVREVKFWTFVFTAFLDSHSNTKLQVEIDVTV